MLRQTLTRLMGTAKMSSTLTAKVRRLSALVAHIQLVRVAQQGLLVFAAMFLAHLLSDPCCAYHRELCARLDEAVKPGRRLLGALPREHAKTTLGTVALVLRELCLGADSVSGGKRNILLVAANREEAMSKLRQIVHEIESNPRLQAAFGARLRPLRDAQRRNVAYADNCIILAGGQRVGVLGFGGKVRGQLSAGRRLDLVVLDDPEDDASCTSPLRRAKLKRWVDQALISALDVDAGSVVWLGSLLHHDCVLAQKMHENEALEQVTGDRSPEEPVVTDTCNLQPVTYSVLRLSAIDDAGAPLWPERWSLAKLEARRSEIGERAFAQEYQNQPVSLSEQVFRPEDFGSFDPAGLRQQAGEWTLDGEPLTVVIGVDPAIGEQRQHDWFCAAAIGLARSAAARDSATADAGPRIYILEVLRVKRPFAQQLELLTALAKRWVPRRIGIEAVAYQAALAQAAWDTGLPVTALGGLSRKWARIETAAVHQAQGRMLLPIAAGWSAAFRQEAAEYPAGSHDDQLDALARALETGLPLIGGAWPLQTAGAKRETDWNGFA